MMRAEPCLHRLVFIWRFSRHEGLYAPAVALSWIACPQVGSSALPMPKILALDAGKAKTGQTRGWNWSYAPGGFSGCYIPCLLLAYVRNTRSAPSI